MLHRFQPGGAISGSSLYIERPADQELLAKLRAGTLCNVLAPRQMGKSSLREHARLQLKREGFVCPVVDFMMAPSTHSALDPDLAWFRWFLGSLAEELQVPGVEVLAGAGLRQPVYEALRTLIQATPCPVTIFLDEIDAVRGRRVAADLFAVLRATVNDRGRFEAWARLRFCLLGVARPQDLVPEGGDSPFNVSQSVRLEDFTHAQAASFLEGLPPAHAAGWLDAVLAWTAGHPYMTQRVLADLMETGLAAHPPDLRRLERRIHELFLVEGPRTDANLYAADSMLRASPRKTQLVALYRRARQGEAVIPREDDPDIAELVLSGMVARREVEDVLLIKPRNRIFEAVFDERWIEQEEGRRPLSAFVHAVARAKQGGPSLASTLVREGLEVPTRRNALFAWADGRDDLTPAEVEILLTLRERWGQEEAVKREQEAVARAEAEARQARADTEREQEARARAEADARSARAEVARQRARRTLVGLGVGAAVLTTAAALAWWSEHRLASARAIDRSVTESMSATSDPRTVRDGIAHLVDLLRDNPTAAEDAQVRYAMFRAVEEQALSVPIFTLWQGAPVLALATSSTGAVAFGTREGETWVSPSSNSHAVLQRRESGAIQDLLWTPDGRHLVIVGATELVVTDFPNSGSAPWLPDLEGHDPSGARLSRDGRLLAVKTDNGGVYLWNVESHTGGHLTSCNTATGLDFDATGATLALGCSGGRLDDRDFTRFGAGGLVSTWDTRSHELRSFWKGNPDWVLAVRFAPDGRTLFASGVKPTVGHWSVDGSLVGRFHGHPTTVWGLEVTPDGRSVIMGAEDGGVGFWNLTEPTASHVAYAHTETISDLAVNTSGALAVVANEDGVASVWDVSRRRLLRLLLGHHSAVASARFVDADRHIITASLDGTVLVWDTPQLPAPPQETCPPGGRLLHDAQGVWSPCGSKLVHLDDAGRPLTTVALPDAGWIKAAILHTGQGIGVDTERRVWVWQPGDTTPTLLEEGPANAALGVSEVFDAALSPDGTRALVSRQDPHVVSLYELATGLRADLPPSRRREGPAIWSPDGRTLVVALGSPPPPEPDRSAPVLVIDPATGDTLHTLVGHHDIALRLAFSPDGTRLATASTGDLLVWDTNSYGEPMRAGLRLDRATDLQWSSDNRSVALADGRNGVWVVSLEPALGVVQLREPGEYIQSVDFDAGGERLLAITSGGRVLVWEVDTRTLIARTGTLPANAAALTADGQALLLVDDGGLGRRVPLDAPSLVSRLCEVAVALDENRRATCRNLAIPQGSATGWAR
jgi:WD40 repeat protein